jgi:hypothetical protein
MPLEMSQYGKFANGRSGREIDASVKERTKARRVNCFIILLGFLLGFAVLYYETILTEMGGFLTPEGRGDAEVVIVEGVELRKEKAVEMGDSVPCRATTEGTWEILLFVWMISNGKELESFCLGGFEKTLIGTTKGHRSS